MKENGTLKEAGRFLYLPGYEDCKFTMKTFRDVFADHPELIRGTYDILRDECAKMLDNPVEAERRDKKLMDDIRDDIHSEYSGSDADDMDDMFSTLINH